VPFLETPHARIAFDVLAPATGTSKLLVLLNGFRRPRQDFRALRKRLHNLDPALATLCIDHVGSGDTECDNISLLSPQLEILAHDVVSCASKVCEELALSNYSLLGISMGGMVAQIAALQNTALNKLVLISTSPKAIPRLSHDIALRDYFGRAFAATHLPMVEAFVKSVEGDAAQQSNAQKASWQRAAIQKFDLSTSLKNILCSTLIISGDDDNVIPSSHSVELSQKISDSTLILYPSVGHVILAEAPDRLTLDVISFLNS
jgi:pimeloyl-ACP methyl ester carboxylesterase